MSLRLRLSFILFALLLSTLASAATTIKNMRIWTEEGRTRIVFDLNKPAEHSIFTLRGPDRLVVDLQDSRMSNKLTSLPAGGAISAIRTGLRADGQLRVVLDLNQAVRSRSFSAGPNKLNKLLGTS